MAKSHELSTAALGMSIGDQNRLADHGLETVRDLTELAFPEQEARPYDYETELMPRRDLFEDLRDDPELGPEIHHYVQQAHAMLGESHDRGSYASSGDGAPPYLLGSGDGSLPADDPPYKTIDLPVARGDLIRIYLNVQHDSRRDRVVMCTGYVTATNYADNGGEPYHLAKIAPDLSMDADASLWEERAVLDGFWDQLTEAVSDIAASLGRADQALIHLYLYTDHERTVLMDAATRHDDGDLGAALRDLLSLRQAAAETSPDQARVSVLQNEVQSRFTLPIPNPRLMPVKHLFGSVESL